jgi:glycosyltransferase involved in cell wall biosynthesis
MRVIFNTTVLQTPLTGVGHYTTELIRALRELGGVNIMTYPYQPLNRIRTTLGGGPSPTAMTRPKWRRVLRTPLRVGYRTLDRIYTRIKLAPTFCSLYHEPNFFPIKTRLPVVVTVHDLSAVLHPEWHPADRMKEYEKNFLPKVSEFAHILTVSDFAREEIIRTFNLPAERVTRTYNGIREQFQPMTREEVFPTLATLGLKPGYLLHVGTIEPRKNLLMLMKAYCDLPSEVREQAPLVLAGQWGWMYKEIAEYYETVAKHRHVIHLGYVPEESLVALYNGARALLFPTHYEGFGMPAAEMLACGGAVIGSKAQAIAEVLGGCGTLLDPNDLTGWRDAMNRLVREDEWRQSLSMGGVQRASEFTWERCALETFAAYQAI